MEKQGQTFQRGMEEEAATADYHVANKGDLKDGVVAMLATVYDTFEPKINEEDVGDGIDEFGDEGSCVIILDLSKSWARISMRISMRRSVPLHTNSMLR